jgi:hypothetical protein
MKSSAKKEGGELPHRPKLFLAQKKLVTSVSLGSLRAALPELVEPVRVTVQVMKSG